MPWLLWRIWKNRNDFLFKGIDYPASGTIEKATEDMKECKVGKRRTMSEHEQPHRATPERSGDLHLPNGSNATQMEHGGKIIKKAVQIGLLEMMKENDLGRSKANSKARITYRN